MGGWLGGPRRQSCRRTRHLGLLVFREEEGQEEAGGGDESWRASQEPLPPPLSAARAWRLFSPRMGSSATPSKPLVQQRRLRDAR